VATSNWAFEGNEVSLTHNYWSGRATLTVNGFIEFERPREFVDWGFAHCFEVNGTPAAVLVRTTGYSYRYQFLTGEDALQVEESNALPVENKFVFLLLCLLVSVAVGGGISGLAILLMWLAGVLH
jgi:hypothetical protein